MNFNFLNYSTTCEEEQKEKSAAVFCNINCLILSVVIYPLLVYFINILHHKGIEPQQY